MVVWEGLTNSWVKKRGERQRRKGKIYPSECRVPKNTKERSESLSKWSVQTNRENIRMGKTRDLFRRRQWHPTPVLLPGKSRGWRSLVGCSPWGRGESNTTERHHFHFSLSCIGEGNGNPLQCSCLENPRDGGAWWAAIYGVAQSRTRLKRLSSSSNVPCLVLTVASWPAYYCYLLYTIKANIVFQFELEATACLLFWVLDLLSLIEEKWKRERERKGHWEVLALSSCSNQKN